jgi:hypothetical protein
MRKIANSSELQQELQKLLRYAQTANPSREKLASELQQLSRRLVAGTGMSVLNQIKSKLSQHGNLAFNIEDDKDIGQVVLSIADKDQDVDDLTITVSIDEDMDEASVGVHSYNTTRAVDGLPISASRLTTEVEKLLKKHKFI